MKKRIQMLLRCGIMLAALMIPLRYLSNMLQRKDSIVRYQSFFEQDADFDVLFLGTSHIIDGVYPMELWRDYGIVSYNLGGHGCYLPIVHWIMMNALDYTAPKLVVIDGYYLQYDTKIKSQVSAIHNALDAFPLSMTKVNAVFDLLDDPEMEEKIKKGELGLAENRMPLGLLWDFSVYHERWADPSKDWFTVDVLRENGAELQVGLRVSNPPAEKFYTEDRLAKETTGIRYLKRMIAECQSRGIDVLLTYIPFAAAEEEHWQEANCLCDIAAQFGLNYINFLETDIVDYKTDCFNASHLNASGGRKVTEYLGRYIVEHYDIPDQRDNPQYSSWHEDYADYEEFKKELLKEQEELDSYLMLLADKNVDALIELDDPALWKNRKYVNLLRNLGADISELEDGTGFILIDGSERAAQCIPCDPSQECVYDTMLGELRIEWGEEGEREVLLNERACVTASPDDGAGIRICALKGDSGERIDEAAFSFAVQERLGKYELSKPVRL